MNRDRSPSRYNDGIGTAAHMMAPMFAYQQKNGAYLHFVDTNSCARRVVLQSMEVITWLGQSLFFALLCIIMVKQCIV